MSSFLPHLVLREILEQLYYNEGLHSLNACALVDRRWSQVAIPLIWQNPFRRNKRSPFDLFTQLLDQECKNSIDMPLLSSLISPVHDYPCYIRELDYWGIMLHCSKWLDRVDPRIDYGRKRHLRKQIVSAMLKMFVDHGALLHSLTIVSAAACSLDEDEILILFEPEICPMLSKINYFMVIEDCVKDKLFRRMAEVCRELKSMNVWLTRASQVSQNALESKNLAKLIRSQHRLACFRLWGVDIPHEAQMAICALSSQYQTLKQIEISGYSFINPEPFASMAACVNLESLKLNLCKVDKIAEPPLVESNLPCLKHVELDGRVPFQLKIWASHINDFLYFMQNDYGINVG